MAVAMFQVSALVESVSVSPTEAYVLINQSTQLTATVLPANANNKAVTWSSSANSVAMVNASGLVTGVGLGNATVTVKTVDGHFVATASVRVISIPAGYTLIPSGAFTMGSPPDEPFWYYDETQHQVTLTVPFLMKITEVTQGEWQTIMGYNPSALQSCGSNCPVEQVYWHEALAYANALSAAEELPQCFTCTWSDDRANCSLKLQYGKPYDCPGYRLPTEVEWEYAARVGTPPQPSILDR